MPESCAPCWTPAPDRMRAGTVMADHGFFSRGPDTALRAFATADSDIPNPNTDSRKREMSASVMPYE